MNEIELFGSYVTLVEWICLAYATWGGFSQLVVLYVTQSSPPTLISETSDIGRAKGRGCRSVQQTW